MRTVRSFANEDREAFNYRDKLAETYRLKKNEARAYAFYMWCSNVSGEYLHIHKKLSLSTILKKIINVLICFIKPNLS